MLVDGVAAFGLAMAAEFGDKTQLVVAGLASTQSPTAVWIGATAGLALTTLLGVAAGRTLLQKLPPVWIYRLSACVFFAFALVAGYHALRSLPW
jgi:putative Ca2+/H+ antiporter (TMEM165/GDT1 family)